jgi:predicted permease
LEIIYYVLIILVNILILTGFIIVIVYMFKQKRIALGVITIILPIITFFYLHKIENKKARRIATALLITGFALGMIIFLVFFISDIFALRIN